MLRTRRLILRNWEERDRALFHRITSDPVVMKFFPRRRNRAEADALMDEIRDGIGRNGFGFAAVEIAETGEAIGFNGLSTCTDIPGRGEIIEIGWRLVPEHWGKHFATEAAAAWLEHGFVELGLHRVYAIAVPENVRSTAVMTRLGFITDPADDFDHPRVPATHPELRRTVCYTLDRADWLRRRTS